MAIGRTTSSAADLMGILTNKKGNPFSDDGTDFNSVFAAAMQSQFSTGTIKTEPDPRGNENDYLPFTRGVPNAPVDLGLYTRSEGYDEFRNAILNSDPLKLTPDLIDPDTGMINAKGHDLQNWQRVEDALPLLPSSLEDAQQRQKATYNELECYTYNLFESQGLEVNQGLNLWFDGSYGQWGAGRWNYNDVNADSTKEKWFETIKGEGADEVNVLAHELAFYSAINSVAENNAAFREQYNSDPEGTVKEYYSQIAQAMQYTDLPSVYNMRDDNIAVAKNPLYYGLPY